MPDLVTIEDVEIVREGTYALSTGEHTFTPGQLRSAVSNAASGPRPRIKIAFDNVHAAGRPNAPSLGNVDNLRLTTLDDGRLSIRGDLTGIPPWFAAVMPSAYPSRSIEASVREDDLRISALELLGVTAPGVSDIEDLRSLYEHGPADLALAASGPDADGNTITVAITSPRTAIKAAIAATQLRPEPDEASKAGTSRQNTPQEESSMDPKNLRERLGLAADASDEDVTAKLDQLTAAPEDVVPATEVDERVQEAVAAARQEEREKIAASGGVVVDQATLDDLKAAADDGRKAREVQIAASRDTFLDEAVKAGKFPPARREHFASLMAADEQGTRDLIGRLEAGLVPVDEIRGSSAADDSSDAPTTTGWFTDRLQEA